MLLSKALRLTDSVTSTVTSHLPGPLATPVNLAVSVATWVPRQVVGLHDHGSTTQRRPEAAPAPAPAPAPTPAPTPAQSTEAAAPAEPEVVLTLDRPAEDVEPPIDVVGQALAAEAAEVPPAHADADHVETDEAIVFSTSTEDAR